jgi:hypothetical protein
MTAGAFFRRICCTALLPLGKGKGKKADWREQKHLMYIYGNK